MNVQIFCIHMAAMELITQHSHVICAITIRWAKIKSLFRWDISVFFSFHLQYDSTRVLARFDLVQTWRYFVIFFGVPSVLFVVSFISLCIITRSVNVGDDAKMRCKYCTDETSDIDDIDEMANKCVQQLNAIEEQNEQDYTDQPSTSKVIFNIFFFRSLYMVTATDM